MNLSNQIRNYRNYNMTIDQRILRFLTKILFHKFENSYKYRYRRQLPVILVTGNVGKSSQTLVLNKIFREAGYKVFSGTSVNRNINSLAGVAMTLMGYEFNMVGMKKWQKILIGLDFYLSIVAAIILPNFKFRPQSIFIYELGYEKQGESRSFDGVFERADALIVTNFGWEHSQGYDDILNIGLLNKIKYRLPHRWVSMLEKGDYPARLKNTILEQLSFLPIAKTSYLPDNPDSISDSYSFNDYTQRVTNTDSRKVFVERQKNLSLLINKTWQTDESYMLPQDFAKTLSVAADLSVYYKIDPKIVSECFANLELPQGRFGLFKGINNSKIVDSTYNNDPASMEGFLDQVEEVIDIQSDNEYLESQNMAVVPKHILIIGEMRELGPEALAEHEKILQRLSVLKNQYKYTIDEIILIGREWLRLDDEVIKESGLYRIVRFAGENWKVFSKAGDINRYIDEIEVRPYSWYWLKGSQNTIFLEIVVEHLLADKSDISKLARRGESWDKVRQGWK